MSNIVEASNTEALVPTQPPTTSITKRSISALRELIAISFWIYAICKLFIFDIDVALINYVDPHYVWIASYKFLILLAIASVILIVTKNKYLLWWSLYVLFYPLILLCWKIPRLAFKKGSWLLLFALINTAISVFRSLKYKFTAFTVFVISTFAVLTFSNDALLLTSIFCLLGVQLTAYVRMAMLVFRPSSIFQIYTKLIKRCPEYIEKTLSDKEIRDLPVEALNESQIGLRRASLQTLVIGNRALLFFGRRLRDYQESKLNAMAYAFNLVLLLVFSVISYAAANYALFKLDAQQYVLRTAATPFLFFYYSFHVFLFNGISELAPSGIYSQMLSMSEQFFAIILLFILIVLFFSVKSERYKEELSRTIQETELGGRALDNLIRSSYRMTQAEAMDEIRSMQSNLMRLIEWLSRDFE